MKQKHEMSKISIVSIFFLVLFFSSSMAQPKPDSDNQENRSGNTKEKIESKLTIKLTKLKNDKGVVRVYLFSADNQVSKDKYPDEEFCIQTKVSAISNKTATIIFDDLPKGQYALYFHHDENNDGKMNSNWIGMPTEGYAFSNNAKPGMTGLPNFKSAQIIIDSSDKTLEVHLTY